MRVPDSNRLFRLLRYNGKSHEHTNLIERESFYDFHIHRATERYQDRGMREDGYAVRTDQYANFSHAIQFMISDANLVLPPGTSPGLFGNAVTR